MKRRAKFTTHRELEEQGVWFDAAHKYHTNDPFCLLYAREDELPIVVLCDGCMWNIMEDRRIDIATRKAFPEFAKMIGLLDPRAPSRIALFAALHGAADANSPRGDER